jgi:hypothetical protein
VSATRKNQREWIDQEKVSVFRIKKGESWKSTKRLAWFRVLCIIDLESAKPPAKDDLSWQRGCWFSFKQGSSWDTRCGLYRNVAVETNCGCPRNQHLRVVLNKKSTFAYPNSDKLGLRTPWTCTNAQTCSKMIWK